MTMKRIAVKETQIQCQWCEFDEKSESIKGRFQKKKEKKVWNFPYFLDPPPPGGYSMEFIYDFFSIPVSQMRVVCVATLGDLNTGYLDIHVKASLNFNGILGGLLGPFHLYRYIENKIKNLNSLPQF